MRFDDSPTDGQSHTGSLQFGGEERLEDAFWLIEGKADARAWDSMFGPIRIDYAFPTSKASYDITQRLHFGAGAFGF